MPLQPDSPLTQDVRQARVAHYVRAALEHCPNLTCIDPGACPDDAYEVALPQGGTRHLDAHVAHLAELYDALATSLPSTTPQLGHIAAYLWDGLKATPMAFAWWFSGAEPQQPSPRLYNLPEVGLVTGITAWLLTHGEMRRVRCDLRQAEHAQLDLRRASLWWQLQAGNAPQASASKGDPKSEVIFARARLQERSRNPSPRRRPGGLDDAALQKGLVRTQTWVPLLQADVGVAAAQGRRPYMEDFTTIVPFSRGVIFGLFDGHGGACVARYATTLVPRLLTQCLEHLSDAHLRNPTLMRRKLKDTFWLKSSNDAELTIGSVLADLKSGSTALVALVLEHGMYIINLGDSRAILADGQGLASPLTFDQKPDDIRERKKLAANHAKVKPAPGFQDLTPRVAGRLAMSRSLGDALARGVLRRPQVTFMFAGSIRSRTLVMGSDGIFDCLSNQSIARGVAVQRQQKYDAVTCAEGIVRAAYAAGSGDNLTAMVVPLDAWKRKKL